MEKHFKLFPCNRRKKKRMLNTMLGLVCSCNDARRLHSAAPAGNGSKCAGKCTFIQSDYRQSIFFGGS